MKIEGNGKAGNQTDTSTIDVSETRPPNRTASTAGLPDTAEIGSPSTETESSRTGSQLQPPLGLVPPQTTTDNNLTVNGKTESQANSPGMGLTETPASSPTTTPSDSQTYTATDYSMPGSTSSGMTASRGRLAADPAVLPIGTKVRIEAGPLSGEYAVANTGGVVRGLRIDIWTPTTQEAMRFGRRALKLTVLEYGGKHPKTRPSTKKSSGLGTSGSAVA